MAVKDIVKRITGADLADAEQEFLRECAAFSLSSERLKNYGTYEDYYGGKFKTQLLDRARRILEANGFSYGENLCETVIDKMASALSVTNVRSDDQAASDWATRRIADIGFQELQGIVHTNVPMLGDGFVAVEFSEQLGRVKWTWNHPRLCDPHYADDGSEMTMLVKCWNTTNVARTNPNGNAIRRMNLYYPDRLEKYFAVGKENQALWAKHIDTEDVDEFGGAVWPVWYTDTGDQDGEPLGITIFHIRNKAKGKNFGRSELRKAIPMQDSHNKSVLDLFYVMDSQAWKVRWGSGVPSDTDLAVAIGEWVTSPDPAARFGELSAEDPRALSETLDDGLRRFAALNTTPLPDLIKGQQPSGESRKTVYADFVSKVLDRQGSYGGAYKRMWEHSLKIEQVYGLDAPDTEDPNFQIDWKSPEIRSDQEVRENLATEVRDLGLSKATALDQLGYDGQAELEKSAEEAASIAEAARRAFDAGHPVP